MAHKFSPAELALPLCEMDLQVREHMVSYATVLAYDGLSSARARRAMKTLRFVRALRGAVYNIAAPEEQLKSKCHQIAENMSELVGYKLNYVPAADPAYAEAVAWRAAQAVAEDLSV